MDHTQPCPERGHKMLQVYIPLASGQYLPDFVLKGIAAQTVGCAVVPCCTPGVVMSNHTVCKDTLKKLDGETRSRNLALDYIIKSGEQYIGMQDRDALHLSNRNYEEAVKFLEDNKDYGAISLPHKEYMVKDHIKLTTMVLRVKAVAGLRFRIDDRKHMCPCFRDDLQEIGYKFGYLPSQERRIKEI